MDNMWIRRRLNSDLWDVCVDLTTDPRDGYRVLITCNSEADAEHDAGVVGSRTGRKLFHPLVGEQAIRGVVAGLELAK